MYGPSIRPPNCSAEKQDEKNHKTRKEETPDKSTGRPKDFDLHSADDKPKSRNSGAGCVGGVGTNHDQSAKRPTAFLWGDPC